MQKTSYELPFLLNGLLTNPGCCNNIGLGVREVELTVWTSFPRHIQTAAHDVAVSFPHRAPQTRVKDRKSNLRRLWSARLGALVHPYYMPGLVWSPHRCLLLNGQLISASSRAPEAPIPPPLPHPPPPFASHRLTLTQPLWGMWIFQLHRP